MGSSNAILFYKYSLGVYCLIALTSFCRILARKLPQHTIFNNFLQKAFLLRYVEEGILQF